MTDKIIVANVDGEEMIFRTEMKKLEKGDNLIVSVSGVKRLAIFIRYIDNCEEYIEDIAFQKVDEMLYKNIIAKEEERIKKEFKDKCMKNYKPIINIEVDSYLRECGFNYNGKQFSKTIDGAKISICKVYNASVLEVFNRGSLIKTVIMNDNLIELIKTINSIILMIR